MKQHILFIDDNEEELAVFLEALRQLPYEDGFKCTFARSALHAQEMLKFLVPDYIFVDMYMPEMDGISFLKFLQNNDRFAHVKKFLYTAYYNDSLEVKALSSGADGCIRKTFPVSRLVPQLHRILEEGFKQYHVFPMGTY